MKRHLRKIAALLILVVLAGILAGCGSGTEKKARIVRIGHNQSTNHPTHIALAAFQDFINEKLGDKYRVEVYPNELLGSQNNMVQLTQTGAIDFCVASNAILDTFSKNYEIFNLPYLFASQEAYEQVNTELATLQADIDIVKAQIELTELRAPFDGIIGLRQISVGAYATPQTVVSKLTRIVPLKLEFAVPERYARDIKPGTRLQFTIDGVLNSFPAKVYAKESAIDMNTHTLTVRALYANPDGRLTPGRYASINLKKQEIKDAIAIPSEAVVPEMGKDKVFLYKSGKAQPVEIKVGLRTEDKVQVIKGLNVGDTLITSGTLQLRTDLPVKLDKVDYRT